MEARAMLSAPPSVVLVRNVRGGAGLVLGGVAGFFVDQGLATGAHVHGHSMIGLEPNGWHNALHLGVGLTGLAVHSSRSLTRVFALTWGSTALVLLIWGFSSNNAAFSLVPLNSADNLVHLVDATGVLIAFLSPRDRISEN
jgi:hypothetical protein